MIVQQQDGVTGNELSYSSDQNVSDSEPQAMPEDFNLETAKPFTAILTGNRVVNPNSFLDDRSEPDELNPPPRDFADNILLRPEPNNREDVLRGLEVHPDGCLVCTDEEMLNKQKGVLPNVAK